MFYVNPRVVEVGGLARRLVGYRKALKMCSAGLGLWWLLSEIFP